MRIEAPPTDKASGLRGWGAVLSLLRAVLIAVAVVGVVLAVVVGGPWLRAITPRWLIRRATIAILWGLLAVFVAAVPAALVVGPWSALSAARARRRRDRPAFERALRRV